MQLTHICPSVCKLPWAAHKRRSAEDALRIRETSIDGVQSGGTIQKTERQGEHRQRDRQVRYRVVSEGTWACSDTLTAPQGHTPLHTHRNTHSNTPWYDYFTCPLPTSHNSRQERVCASVRAQLYQLCVCVMYGCMFSGVCILARKSAVTLLIVCARNVHMTVCKMRASVLMCFCFVCVCVCARLLTVRVPTACRWTN